MPELRLREAWLHRAIEAFRPRFDEIGLPVVVEGELPLDRYKTDDPFENHPLFKTEEQARIEETMDGQEPAVSTSTPLAWPTDSPEDAEPKEEGLWSRSRDFDWGD